MRCSVAFISVTLITDSPNIRGAKHHGSSLSFAWRFIGLRLTLRDDTRLNSVSSLCSLRIGKSLIAYCGSANGGSSTLNRDSVAKKLSKGSGTFVKTLVNSVEGFYFLLWLYSRKILHALCKFAMSCKTQKCLLWCSLIVVLLLWLLFLEKFTKLLWLSFLKTRVQEKFV